MRLPIFLFNSYGFCKIAGVVNVATAEQSDLVGKYLTSGNADKGREQRLGLGKNENAVAVFGGMRKIIGADQRNVSASCAYLANISCHLIKISGIVCQCNNGRALLNERERSVLQLTCGVCLAVYVGDLLELQRAFGSGGAVRASSDKVEVVCVLYGNCQLADLVTSGDDLAACGKGELPRLPRAFREQRRA